MIVFENSLLVYFNYTIVVINWFDYFIAIFLKNMVFLIRSSNKIVFCKSGPLTKTFTDL